MMRLAWSDVRARAQAFAEDWADETYERGEAQSFYNELFHVFGQRRRGKAAFEARVKLDKARNGRIDLFWPGVLLAEHKSAGKDLIRAREQALAYIPGLQNDDVPKYVLVCDFQTFELTDLDSDEPPVTFALAELPAHVERFGFIMGAKRRTFREQPKADIIASELMAKLHDDLKAGGYEGAELERYLVRLLFCLFAEDTGIFEQGSNAFEDFVRQRTREDGSDLGPMLGQLWEVLDTPEEKRRKSLDEELRAFPYINGELFRDRLPTADFNRAGRERLLEACGFRWNEISPAIFGSLFQGVMNAKERRKKGAHYTTERNILKVIEPLLLDDLRSDFERAKKEPITKRRRALDALHDRIANLRFLDPACGCGNFLVITYRELRRLETELLVARYKAIELSDAEARGFSVASLSRLNVDNFYGIELEEFPCRIAEVALWMTDHIENNRLAGEFGEPFRRIPLKTAPHIVHADALEMDWSEVLPPQQCSYVLGNPPFIGFVMRGVNQQAQASRVMAQLGATGARLDYVAAWLLKAGQYVTAAVKPLLPPGRPMSADEAIRYATARTGEFDLDSSSSTAGEDQLERSEAGRASSARSIPRREPPAPRIGFVATNSITQGEQVAQLWPALFERFALEIIFAHRTFEWGSDARGVAQVHVVVLGLARRGQVPTVKRLFSYEDGESAAEETHHASLSPYLFSAEGLSNRHLVIRATSKPLGDQPPIRKGVEPVDDGHYILDQEELTYLSENEPLALRHTYQLVGGREYINGEQRWIIVASLFAPNELKQLPLVRQRIQKVRDYRRQGGPLARSYADDPTRFHVLRRPQKAYLVIPEVSSIRREYIPLGWVEPPSLPSGKTRFIENASVYLFGVLTSRMHMSWVRHVGGRVKSDYSYSGKITYNTFPWPEAKSVQRTRVEALAQAVLDARAAHPDATLADLYDPDLMPADLRRAHRDLDRAVDRLYRPAPFTSDRERAEHLFGLYEALTRDLLSVSAKPKRRIMRTR